MLRTASRPRHKPGKVRTLSSGRTIKSENGPPPKSLSDLTALDEQIKKDHPGVASILWDYKSAYYSWGILASAGAYIYAKKDDGYDLGDVGVADAGAVEALSKIIGLVDAGILPKSISYSATED